MEKRLIKNYTLRDEETETKDLKWLHIICLGDLEGTKYTD